MLIPVIRHHAVLTADVNNQTGKQSAHVYKDIVEVHPHVDLNA